MKSYLSLYIDEDFIKEKLGIKGEDCNILFTDTRLSNKNSIIFECELINNDK